MPAGPYVTLADLKAYIGETGTDEDSNLRAAIDAASAMIERHLCWDPALVQRTEVIRGEMSRFLWPKATPITAVASVQVDGKDVAFKWDIQTIQRTDGGRFTFDAPATVVYTAGLDPLPDDLVLATKMTAQAVYEAAVADPNVYAEQVGGAFAATYQQAGPGSIPPAARGLLEPLRRRF